MAGKEVSGYLGSWSLVMDKPKTLEGIEIQKAKGKGALVHSYMVFL
ncbi:hypothetical protein [Shewanella woodyi]|nr:hypothetical protein [Shewanella woodyi]